MSYEARMKEELGYDLVIDCLGYSFKTDYMKNSDFRDCLAKTG
jgi:hypothetical protein